MDFLFSESVLYYIYIAIILLISIGLHEYAHAYASFKLGDPTPVLQGRLTPNPLKHLDPIWFILIFIIGFGRGKPVQINPSYYKHPLKDELLTALAWPGMNLFLALIGMLFLMVYSVIVGTSFSELLFYQFDMIQLFWWMFITVNLALMTFNLLPIFPLDGYRLVKITRKKGALRMERNALIVTIVLLTLILLPGRGIIGSYIATVSDFLYRILFSFFSLIFY